MHGGVPALRGLWIVFSGYPPNTTKLAYGPVVVAIIDDMNTRPVYLFFLTIALAVLFSGSGICSENPDLYNLTIHLSPDSQQLEGEASFPVSPTLTQPSVYSLRLSPQAELLSLTFGGNPVGFSFEDGILNVNLPKAQVPSTLTVRYRTRYADALPESTVGMENPSFGVSATIGEYGAYLSSGTAWFPQPQLKPKKYRIRIEGPKGFYGVTSGKLTDHGTLDSGSYTVWETSSPLGGLALSAGYFRIYKEQIDDIQVLAFLTEKNAALASVYLDPAKKYIQFYQRLLGPYPFSKFAIVENFLPTGYGLPSWTLLGSNVIALPFIPHTSLPHEIVHSWFGNAVEVDYRKGNWAEGLTSYLADYLLKEQRSDELGREHRLKLLRDYAALVEPQQDYPLTRFVSRTSKPDQAIGYGKGAMVFHMLRRQIGEEAFWSGLRRLAAEGQGKRLGWDEIHEHFDKVANQDLAAFFAQWTEQSGAPSLRFTDVSVLESGGGWDVRGMVEQSEPFYHIDLPLQLKTEAGTLNQSVLVKHRKTPFAIRTDAPALQLSGDPDAHLFRRLQADELPSTINDLRASRKLLVIVESEQSPLLDASADLLRGLQKFDAPVVTWQKLEPVVAQHYDLLFIGWPPVDIFDVQGLLLQSATRNSFDWEGVTYQDESDSLFLCRQTKGKSRQMIAVFHPLSADAASAVARKIPHYGRYGHLIFRDGANLIKGTDEPGHSPLSVKLD